MTEKGRTQPEDLIAKLDPPAEDILRMGEQVIRLMSEYYDTLPERSVYPNTSAPEIRDKLERRLPQEGNDFERLLDVFRHLILPMDRHNGHPRFFGYVSSPGTAATALADLLASVLNANVTSWRSAPAATNLERLTIGWIKQIIGYQPDAEGLFVSGGSMANLSALAVARGVKAPVDVAGGGAQSLDRAMRIYISAEGHHSITKAAGLLGIGAQNVHLIGVDEQFRMDTNELLAKIEEDRAAGHLPFCIVASAGTVNTGAVDPLGDIADIARRHGLWLHVDASYGGFAVLAPSVRHFFDHLASADSVALDPHKWLYLPVDCGCVLYRDPAAARATFGYQAEYTRVMDRQPEKAFAFWDYGPELSRRFRALKVWVMLSHVGVRALGQAIERNMACARYLEALVDASEDFEMLAPVQLSIFCFRYIPPRLKQELETAKGQPENKIELELDALNERLMIELQRNGTAYLTNARPGGRFALRGCVINYRTRESDMEILLDELRQTAKRIEAG